jgi:UDP-N-acetylglucosamine transferase subunit ALG13
MSFGEMLEHFAAADAVVTHAGVGSILCARRAGHVPVVTPRQRRYGEHVDDHQEELVEALEDLEAVVAVREMDRLPDAVDAVRGRRPAPNNGAGGGLPRAVKEALYRWR